MERGMRPSLEPEALGRNAKSFSKTVRYAFWRKAVLLRPVAQPDFRVLSEIVRKLVRPVEHR